MRNSEYMNIHSNVSFTITSPFVLFFSTNFIRLYKKPRRQGIIIPLWRYSNKASFPRSLTGQPAGHINRNYPNNLNLYKWPIKSFQAGFLNKILYENRKPATEMAKNWNNGRV
jgi:hypothetical protein